MANALFKLRKNCFLLVMIDLSPRFRIVTIMTQYGILQYNFCILRPIPILEQHVVGEILYLDLWPMLKMNNQSKQAYNVSYEIWQC